MKVFLIAGETSGDLIGADLIAALRIEDPSTECFGAGGERMLAAGQRQSIDLAKHGVVGLIEVIKHYPRLRSYFHRLLAECQAILPDAIVLIDYPGFNLRFLKKVRELLPSCKIFYYVSPQVWAWKPERASILEKNVDALFCIFPFEPDWFREKSPNLKTHWLGHPILDRLFLPENNATPEDKIRIALLPGSRPKEVETHLPLLLEAAMIMTSVQGNFSFYCIAPTPEVAEVEAKMIEQQIGYALDIQVLSSYTATHISRCHLALVSSGTATLECAVANTPMVVFYKVNWLTYLFAKMLVKIPFLSIVNLLLNEGVVPELIQSKARPNHIARAAIELLASESKRKAQQKMLRKVVEDLGEPGASRRITRHILKSLKPVSPL